jgi:hypothetical protein
MFLFFFDGDKNKPYRGMALPAWADKASYRISSLVRGS